MPPAFSLRRLTADDEPAVLDVYCQCEDFLALGPVATASLFMVQADMNHAAEQGSLYCGIFNRAGVMMGVVDYLPQGFERQPEYAFLELLMIAAPYRGQGLGAAVVAAVEAEIRHDPGVTIILSGVQVNNPGAIRFWQRQGYRIVSEPELLPDATVAVRLRKDL
ncbi:MAG: GNAT family N-acetyltransferase [Chloroflexi bacterium]|nr:GNAT family N-acetyltransferase [Chloroflexota bacterium]